jgi:hypothetical protein
MKKLNLSASKWAILLFTGLFVAATGQTASAQNFIRSYADQAPALSFQAYPTAQPKWYPYVIARRPDRAVIENTPIEFRPYRPLHFYGNSVRRNYYRGSPAAFRR